MEILLPVLMFCFLPLALLAVGFWLGRGAPGIPFRLNIERRGAAPPPDNWQP